MLKYGSGVHVFQLNVRECYDDDDYDVVVSFLTFRLIMNYD